MKRIFITALLLSTFLINTACSETPSNGTPVENNGLTEEPHETIEQNENQESNESPGYLVAKKNELIGDIYHYYIIPDDVFLSEDVIRQISHEVVEQAKEEIAFTHLMLFFIADKIDIDRPYNIAHVMYYPTEHEVVAGNYDGHTYTYTFGAEFSGMLPRDDEHFPTKKEREIYYYFMDIYLDWDLNLEELDVSQIDFEKHYDEKQAHAILETTNKFGASIEKVEEIIAKFNREE